VKVGSLLVVCTGNICRSPYAAAYFRQHLPRCRVDSAGTGAPESMPADEIVAEFARDDGMDLSEHRSKLVTMPMLRDSELILVMERYHLQTLQQAAPEVTGRTLLLGHWNEQRDLPDPHRQSMDMYLAVFSQLREDLALWAGKLG